MKKRIVMLLTVIVITAVTLHSSSMTKANTRDTWIAVEYQKYIEIISEKYHICPELIQAIVECESSGQAEAVNGTCMGLMQISVPFHRDRMIRLGATDIYDPQSNILVGTDYLAELFEEYDDLGTVLMIYHGETDAVNKGENGNYSKYANSIMERSEELERIHGK